MEEARYSSSSTTSQNSGMQSGVGQNTTETSAGAPGAPHVEQTQSSTYAANNYQPDEDEIRVPFYFRLGSVVVNIAHFWVGVGISFILLRITLLMFGANPASGFANFVYEISGDYMAPFRNIFPTRSVNQTSYLDVSGMFAVLVYSMLSWFIASGVDWMRYKIRNYQVNEFMRRQMHNQQEPQASRYVSTTTHLNQ